MSLIIQFHNDGTGTERVGNYDVTVYINREPIEHLRIEGHDRSKGWVGLVRTLALTSPPSHYTVEETPTHDR